MARLYGDRLGDQSPQAIEIHYAIELTPESGGAGGEK
jgi:hypothetical protein